MRWALLVAAAALLAGCTAEYPETARVVTEVEAGTLEAGQGMTHNFSLAEPAGFLVVGLRTGPAEHVHATLRGPSGVAYDLAAGSVLGACAVTNATAGPWVLEVRADPHGGFLRGGKFTVRAAPGAPPPVIACADDAFPGQGRVVTLGRWTVDLNATPQVEQRFEQPFDLARIQVPPLGGANASVLVAPPGGDFTAPSELPASPPQGTWRVRIAALPEGEPPANATVAVQGIGR